MLLARSAVAAMHHALPEPEFASHGRGDEQCADEGGSRQADARNKQYEGRQHQCRTEQVIFHRFPEINHELQPILHPIGPP